MNQSRHQLGRRVASVIAATALLAVGLAPGTISLAQSPVPSGGVEPPPGPLSVDGAWVRTSPMVDMAGAAYLVIHNSGTTDDALIGITTPAAASVELHQTAPTASGEMLMQPVASIPVPAGGSVELKPGGYHAMLIGLTAPLQAGTTVELLLTFQSGDPHTVLLVEAPVTDSAPVPMPSGSVMPMDMAPASTAP